MVYCVSTMYKGSLSAIVQTVTAPSQTKDIQQAEFQASKFGNLLSS